jgi:hypothetical protein
MPDDHISAQQNLESSRRTRQELFLQIKQSLETIQDAQELLRRVNAQIESAQIARTDEKTLDLERAVQS